jgi:alpha-beta hydrolase superfamily lysophospholipase
MSLMGLRIAATVLLGTSLLTVAGSVLGEMVATMPPLFREEAVDAIVRQGIQYEEVAFPTGEGLTLRGWFFPADRPDAPAIVYAPATAHDQRSGLSLVPALHAADYHVLLFSYRGHALSDGNRWGFTYGDAESRDLDAAVRFLQESRGLGPIGVIGHSAGAVSGILSAARNPEIGAVVAVAPFTCVDEVWATNRPTVVPQPLLDLTLRLAEMRKGFDRRSVCTLDAVHLIAPRPLLIIHGTQDQRITQEQVHRLFAAAEEPKSLWLVEGASHNSVRDPMLDQLMPKVIAFLDNALRAQEKQLTSPVAQLDGEMVGEREPAPSLAN